MKNIKKIALLMIAMMLCVFMSSGIVNAAADGEDTGGGTPNLCDGEHEMTGYKQVPGVNKHRKECKNCDYVSNESWCYGTEKQNSTHHYKHCNTCGRNWNYVEHNFENKHDDNYHWKECNYCGYEVDKGYHDEIAIYTGDEWEHDIRCSTSWCYHNSIPIYTDLHYLNQGTGIDEHKCECGYNPGTHHGFGTEGYCLNELCGAWLILKDGVGVDEIRSLPDELDYHMVGSGVDWEKEPPQRVTYTTNYTPYIYEDSDEIVKCEMYINSFEHKNYAQHIQSYEEDMVNRGEKAVEIPKKIIREPLRAWNIAGMNVESSWSSQVLTATYNNRTYTIEGFPAGHWIIENTLIGFNSPVGEYHKLYCKGDDHPPFTPIYAFLNVGYRDMEGNKIIGAPEDLDNKSKRVVTWLNGNTGAKFTFSPNGGSVTLDLEGLDKLGWRYKGYKYMKTLDVPSNVSPTNLNSAESGTINTSLDDNVHTLVFFFEPIKVTVNHINEDREKINTNKNIEYNLPEIINKTGHVCTTLECEHKTISEADRVPGDTATKHNNTSLNKYLWPGYILKEYTLKTENSNKTVKSKTYDLINNYPIESATTRTATAEDDAKYGVNNVPQELYQKTVDIPVDISTGESAGYRDDLVLDFIYTNVDVKVSHRDFGTRNTYRDTANNELAYTQMLNGHYFIVSSLILDGETHTLPETGGQYNMKGYVLREIEVAKKNKTIWNKIFTYEQNETNGLEATAAINTLYYILSSNDITAEIINEINRIGSDIEFKFYYEKVPMLTIKHMDEYGNKLWPDEYKVLNSASTPADSKNLKQFTYVYKEYYLDDKAMQTPGTEAVQVDPNSDIRRVYVPRNGELDRELIYIYKQDIPTLLVKYVDEAGNEIAERTTYKMDKDSVSTSAKDLSGIKDADGNSYEYRDYTLYEGANEATPVTNTGTEVTVTVPKTGNDRLLVYVYLRKGNAEIIDSSQIKSESVILKSNYRPDEAGKNGEEYNVLRAIPTSEDLYANVITDSFLLSNVVSQKETTERIHVKLVQPYYKTNNEDDKDTDIAVTDKAYAISSNDYITIELPYSYFTAENVQLNLISRAVVKNDSIEVRDTAGNIKELNKVTIFPKYEKNPELKYKAGGELVFNDLSANYSGMAGKTVEEYIDGMASGAFNLKSGFYNVKEIGGEKYVEYVLPEIQYTEVKASDMNKIVGEYKLNPYLLTRAAEQNDVRVTMDTLKVIRENDAVVTILSGAALPINREYTLIQLESMKNSDGTPILDTTPDEVLISNNVLYKKDEIYITETEENKEYETTADVWYKPHQRVNPTTLQVEVIDNNDTFTQVFTNYELSAEGEILVEAKKDIVGNSVFVHTPVVNDTTISDNSKGIANNQLIQAKSYTEAQKKSILVLGQPFKIKIPNKGTHINETGYGTKDYNYKGLVSEGDTQVNGDYNAFALDRQIKFTFGVIYNGKYYKANEWISLGVSETEEFEFVAPEWEKELWKNTNNHKIETRVIAENGTTAERIAKTQEGKNTVRDNYVATKKIDVKLIGELLDLEIRATNDPSYSNYKTEGTSGMPIGQAGQANGGKAYKYGIKLGYSVYFDITSTGWNGDTTEKVNLTPKYYYVSKNGGTATPVDLYYRVVGNPNYVSLNNVPRTLTTIMSADAIKGSRCKSRFASLLAGTNGFFNANAGIEMSNTTRLIAALRNELEDNYVKTTNKTTVNYSTPIQTGNTKLVTLPYTVRLAYANAINAMLNGKYLGVTGLEQVSENAKNYCIGHWYGAFKLPATTVAVDPGSTPKPDKSNAKKDGYIIVSFEEVKSESGGTPYLEVTPERFALDGGDTSFTLPNERPGNVPNLIPAIIYETDVAMNQDAEVGGTH